MKSHITIKEWLTLDQDARRQLSAKFQIRHSDPGHIMHQPTGTVILSDGVANKDLDEAFSIEHMIEYLKEDLPWYREDLISHLFALVQDKFYGRDVRWSERDSGGDSSSAGAEGIKSRGKGRSRKEAPPVPEVA